MAVYQFDGLGLAMTLATVTMGKTHQPGLAIPQNANHNKAITDLAASISPCGNE